MAPSFTPDATPDVTPSPTDTPPPLLVADDIAEVVTNDLVVRSLPEISDRSLIDRILLNAGKLLFILDGPVAGDGFEWYRVVPFEPSRSDLAPEEPDPGWVAAGRRGEAWIVPWTGPCPEPRLEEVMLLQAGLRIACFGSTDITLVGTFTDCGGVTGYPVGPAWLNSGWCNLTPVNYGFDLFSPLQMHWDESMQFLHEYAGKAVRATGHFDDPAALACRASGDIGVSPEELVLGCRGSFVVTEMEVIG